MLKRVLLYQTTIYPVVFRPVALIDWLERCTLEWSVSEADDNIPPGVIEGLYLNAVAVFPVSVALCRVPVL